MGKSSFMNRVTRPDVEAQTCMFATNSLFVGQMDCRYLCWHMQVMDAPGILLSRCSTAYQSMSKRLLTVGQFEHYMAQVRAYYFDYKPFF